MAEDRNDPIRQLVHAMWAGVAPQWGEHADQVDSRGPALTERLLDAAAVSTGDRVLELACGPGGAGLAAAERVGMEGEVLLSDVAEEMATIAGNRAAARGLSNVQTVALDLEAIDQPDQAFDAVLCREGLMFAVEPNRAVDEVFRVLRPGGRTALSVWAAPADNPWLGEMLDAATAVLGMPLPPPGVPGPFSLADADLGALLAAVGFVDVAIEDVPVPHRTDSFDEYWNLTSDLAGPLAAVLAGLDEETTSAIQERVRAAFVPYSTDAGLDIPGLSRMVSGRRP
jgi:ubiquinone/menaquinone biosynthesis C-methylase UbiE